MTFSRASFNLLSQINYNQIGEALSSIQSIEMNTYKLYSFMNRDFGLSFIGNFEKPEIRQDFLKIYSQLDEYDLYEHYLFFLKPYKNGYSSKT